MNCVCSWEDVAGKENQQNRTQCLGLSGSQQGHSTHAKQLNRSRGYMGIEIMQAPQPSGRLSFYSRCKGSFKAEERLCSRCSPLVCGLRWILKSIWRS